MFQKSDKAPALRGTDGVRLGGWRMMTLESRFIVGVSLVIILSGVVAAHGQAPDVVSPGGLDNIAAIEGRCPSFSWGVVPGAEHYQLICYRLPEGVEPSEADLERAEQALYTEVPGAATSWTPNLELCLPPGESYVWFVRAVFRENHGEVVEAGEWSYGRFFSTSRAPSTSEVEEALDMYTRYRGNDRARAPAIDASTREIEVMDTGRPEASQRSDLEWQPQKSLSLAGTAIRGSLSDTTGEIYGVVGISNSAEGAGVGAVGAAGGPDLVLDGSADLLVDAEFSQSGIDRRWGSPQTFNIENSMGGGMTLRVDGVPALTSASAVNADTLDGIHGTEFATDSELGMHAASADHDGRYFTESELSTSGGGGTAHWDSLTSVPGDLANGDDDTVPVLPGSGWRLHAVTTVDSGGDVGQDTSIMVGVDGLPVIGYFDDTNNDLKVAHCSDLACTSATVTTVDSVGSVGYDPSVAVGADGLPVISYCDSTNDQLKVAHCSNLECTTANANVVDSGGNVGWSTSITVGTDGLPVISYYDSTNNDLKVAHCSDVACSAATTNVVDSGFLVGNHSSITVGADGLPVISYFASNQDDLMVAHCSDLECGVATTYTVDSGGGVGLDTSIAVGADGLPVISYYDITAEDLKVAHCSNVFCIPYARRR